MLQNSKNVLFDDQHKVKLENADLPLEEWVSQITQQVCKFKVEKIVAGKKMMRGKRYAYRITTTDPLWPTCEASVRTKSDFLLLYLQLEKRFPNAVVPKVSKNEADNLHLMELYLTELSLNPFFRMDMAFSDFLNGKFKEYKHTKKNEKKHSQGTLRWLQQTTEYREVEMSDVLVKSLKSEFDQLERTQKGLLKALKVQRKALGEMQSAANLFSGNLGDYLAMEQASVANTTGSVAGIPEGMITNHLNQLIALNSNHLEGLKQAYDPGSLKRLTGNPIKIELKMLAGLRKVLDICFSSLGDFQKAQKVYDSVAPEDDNWQKHHDNLELKKLIYFKERRAMGYELERFRTYRTIKFKSFLNNYVKFQLRGTRRMNEEWTKSGMTLDDIEEMEFFRLDDIYNQQMQDMDRKSSIGSMNYSTRSRQELKIPIGMKDLSVFGINHQNSPKEEFPTSYLPDNGSWQGSPDIGQTAQFHDDGASVQGGEDHMTNQPMASSPAPSFGFNSQMNGLPPVKPNFNLHASRDIEGADDWSASGDGSALEGSSSSKQEPGMQMPTPPSQAAGLPPGFNFGGSNNPTPPASSPVAFSASPNGFSPPTAGSFGSPKPPGGAEFRGPTPPSPAFGFGGPTLPPGGTFGGPTPPSGGPGFGGPTPPSTGFGFGGPTPPSTGFGFAGPTPPSGAGFKPAGMNAPGQMGNAPPSFGGAPFGGGSPGPKPPAAAPKPIAMPKATAGGKKKKFGGGNTKKLGGGMPAGPGGGGMAFLADIKKGNAVKLNKVGDPDANRPPPGAKKVGGGGGGGGFQGQLAAAMAKMKKV